MNLLGIQWDPDITGYLAVGIGIVILCGGVFLLLYTNMGTRLGFLVAWTGFWSWMFLMGIVWWVYGIGYIGTGPSWDAVAATTDLNSVNVEEIREISDFDPGDPVPEDWRVQAANERGDVDAAGDAELTKDDRFGFVGNALAYQKFEVLETGGEEYWPLGIPENVVIELFVPSRSTPKYAVVQVQGYEEQEPVDLNTDAPPPDAVINQSAPVVSVVLVRDRGNLRVPPAMVTIFSGALFGIGAWMLHRRDKEIMAMRAAAEGAD